MDFNELCIGCRTYRRFQPKEIDAGILDELMENVRIANSAMNAQVLRYVLVREPSLTAAMQPLIIGRERSRRSLARRRQAKRPWLLSSSAKRAAEIRGTTSTWASLHGRSR